MTEPAIVLSTHTMGLGVIRSLGIMGVPTVAVYHDRNDMGYVSRYVTEKIYAPHPEKHEERFIDLLMGLADQYRGGVLIPASDETLTTVSKHKDLLERHYIVACTGWEITRKFIDKRYTYALADEAGVPAPKTFIPVSLADLEKYEKAVQYPCLVKPRQSHRYHEIFRTKMVMVNDFEQMVRAYRQATDAGLEVMIQEIIPGDDSQTFNYNSYFWDGRPLVEFTAQQIRKAPPRFGAPRVVISKDVPEIIEPGRSILRAMGFSGYSCTEFKKDARDGSYKLMEVNGRHNRSTLLAVRCGLNFPWLQYRHLVSGQLPSSSHYRNGVYWISLDKDIVCNLRYFHRERYSPMQYIRPYLRPHVFDIFDWKDLKPFLLRITNVFQSLVRSLLPSGRKEGLTGMESAGQ
jgi:D-aspartate ligase